MALTIKQGFEYQGNDWWKWWIWVDGPADELNQVEKVTYTLHRTFPNPVRTMTDRTNNFRLDASGWGVFRIHVAIQRKDGSKEKLQHDLVLEYPPEPDAQAKG